MIKENTLSRPASKPRYRTIVEGVELANDFSRSGLRLTEFARQRGVSLRMVQYWSARARELAAASSPDVVQVAEISANGAITPVPQPPALPPPTPRVESPPPTIEIRLPNGVRIGIGPGFSPESLKQVIACLASRAC